jgi:hypothetical protein
MTLAIVLIERGFVSVKTYNTLLTIEEVANVLHENATDLEDLRQLLTKYNVLEVVDIRLIYKHFNITNSEAIVFRDIALLVYSIVKVIRVIVIASARLYKTYFLINSIA